MKKKSAYLVGIKGIAMAALAVYLKERNYDVSGSDVAEKFLTDSVLEKYNIPIYEGFNENNIRKNYDLVVVTGAHGGMTNREAVFAKKKRLNTYMHGEILGKLMGEQSGITISGCHGKTTTSAMVASLLSHAACDPSYAIGCAGINDLGLAGHFGRGKYFVAEGDEYMTCPLTNKTPRFLWQKPEILIITNIDYDHPDAYKNIDEVKSAFISMINNVTASGTVIANRDDKNTAGILKPTDKKIITYGFSPESDYCIYKYHFQNGKSYMKIRNQKRDLGEFVLGVPGKHNLLNALAAMIAANTAGTSWNKIRRDIKKFTGTKRRFEKYSSKGEIAVYDDYAHHPNEIIATLSGVKEWYPDRRIITIFQPHTISRTKALFSDFTRAFLKSDIVIFTEIYASARENKNHKFSSKNLQQETSKYKNDVSFFSTKGKTLSYLKKIMHRGDIILTMGAGDIYKWCDDISKLIG